MKGITLKEMIVCLIVGTIIGIVVPLVMYAFEIGFDHSNYYGGTQ